MSTETDLRSEMMMTVFHCNMCCKICSVCVCVCVCVSSINVSLVALC